MIVTVLVGLSAFVVLDNAETSCSFAQITETGRCGNDMTYSLSTDGTLAISGSGRMYDYSETNAPWSAYCSDITRIIIDDKIISLGEWAFRDCTNLKILTIPITLNSVRSNIYPAFAGCTGIVKVNLTYGTNGNGYGYDAYPVNDRWYQNTPWYLSRDSLKEVNFADSIKSIGSDSFRELNITSLTAPESVVALGNHTFFNCEKLTDLTYPVSLKPFNDDQYPAFEGCKAIEKVTLTRGNGVPFDYGGNTSYISISDSCSKLAPWNMNSDVKKTIVISDNVSKLGRYAFCHSNIKELSIPISIEYDNLQIFNGVECIEKVIITKGTDGGANYDEGVKSHAPWNVLKKIDTIIVDEGVTRFGYTMFYNCDIENLVLPNSLVSFGKGSTFEEHTRIKNLTIPITLNAAWLDFCDDAAFSIYTCGLEKITFTPGDTGIGFNYATYKGSNCWYLRTPWYYCSDSLKEIVFEDGIKSIGSNAFRDLNITSVVIPDSVESLGEHAFLNCKELTDLTVPADLDTVGSNDRPAFFGCTNIANITFTSGTGVWHESGTDPDWSSCYKNTPWNLTDADLTVTICGVEHIGEYAFRDWSPLKHLYLEGATSIDKGAFYGCKQLQSVSASSDLIRIDQLAFAQCPTLQFVHIPDSVTSIGHASFANCPSLAYLYIGNSVTSIGDSAFYRCESLSSVVIPDSVESIGTHAFDNCGSLLSVVIPDSVKSIGTHAFDNCGSLVSVTIGNSVESIGNYAFNYCTTLTSVSLSDSVTSVGRAAFAYCWALTEANLGNSVTEIGDYAFYQCTRLTSVTIPDSVTSIGISAFAYAPLTELNLASVVTIGDYAFYQCTKLTDVTIPDSVVTIGNYAFCDSLDSLEQIYVSKNLKNLENEAFGYSHGTVKVVNRIFVFELEVDVSCSDLAGHQFTVEHRSDKIVFKPCPTARF